MKILANILGLCAVACFVLSYQLKSRRGIILLNAASRILFVSQYLLLGAYEGVLLGAVAFPITLLCKNRERGWIKRHFWLTVILSNLCLIAAGLVTYRDVYSLLPLLGVTLETLALWPRKESHIRALSLLGVPFWLVYNLHSGAYGASVGNVFALVSLGLAILRYDLLKKEKAAPGED